MPSSRATGSWHHAVQEIGEAVCSPALWASEQTGHTAVGVDDLLAVTCSLEALVELGAQFCDGYVHS
jgi:hypothetical protein